MLSSLGGGGSPAIFLSDAFWSPSRCATRGMTAGGKLVAQSVDRHFQELHRGCLLQLHFKNRIEPLEHNSRVLGSKAPIDFDPAWRCVPPPTQPPLAEASLPRRSADLNIAHSRRPVRFPPN